MNVRTKNAVVEFALLFATDLGWARSTDEQDVTRKIAGVHANPMFVCMRIYARVHVQRIARRF